MAVNIAGAASMLSVTLLLGCGGVSESFAAHRKDVAAAASRRDSKALHARLHATVQANISEDELADSFKGNPKEIDALASGLASPNLVAERRAEVRLSSGDVVGLVYEDDDWVIDDGPFGATDLSTPQKAMRAFRRALRQESLGSFREVLGPELRAKRDFSVEMLLEQTEDEHAMDLEQSENFARFETPSGIEIEFRRDEHRWLLENVQAPPPKKRRGP